MLAKRRILAAPKVFNACDASGLTSGKIVCTAVAIVWLLDKDEEGM